MARESSLAERQRHDQEKAEDIKARQVRLGHVPAPEEAEEKKTRSRAKKKTETEEE